MRRSDYLAGLPEREFLPMFWPQPLLDCAAATSLDTAQAAADFAAMQHDYAAEVQPLARKHKRLFRGAPATLDAFLAASSWVSSRAFHVDEGHGASPLLCLRLFVWPICDHDEKPGRAYLKAPARSARHNAHEHTNACRPDLASGESELGIVVFWYTTHEWRDLACHWACALLRYRYAVCSAPGLPLPG